MLSNELVTKDTQCTFDRAQVIEALANFRKACEKEAEAEGISLMHMPLNIGYVFGDLALILNLTTEEQLEMLGPKLRKEFFRSIG